MGTKEACRVVKVEVFAWATREGLEFILKMICFYYLGTKGTAFSNKKIDKIENQLRSFNSRIRNIQECTWT